MMVGTGPGIVPGPCRSENDTVDDAAVSGARRFVSHH